MSTDSGAPAAVRIAISSVRTCMTLVSFYSSFLFPHDGFHSVCVFVRCSSSLVFLSLSFLCFIFPFVLLAAPFIAARMVSPVCALAFSRLCWVVLLSVLLLLLFVVVFVPVIMLLLLLLRVLAVRMVRRVELLTTLLHPITNVFYARLGADSVWVVLSLVPAVDTHGMPVLPFGISQLPTFVVDVPE